MRLTLIELSPFVAKWSKMRLNDEDLRALESLLIANPEAGAVIPGTGGLRKLRFAPSTWHTGKCSNACRIGTRRDLKESWRMSPKTTKKSRHPRVADEIMAGMRELERMMDEGKTPEQMFTVKTVEIPDPNVYRAKRVRELRDSLGVSQAVFAHLLGVSVILVKSWERGTREPSLMARRLLDTIRADPARWLATVREMAAA
jgi:DNA-binding transcriptional regulator YiaG